MPEDRDERALRTERRQLIARGGAANLPQTFWCLWRHVCIMDIRRRPAKEVEQESIGSRSRVGRMCPMDVMMGVVMMTGRDIVSITKKSQEMESLHDR